MIKIRTFVYLDDEVWEDLIIDGFVTDYLISNFGRLYSFMTNKLHNQVMDSYGYTVYSISYNGQKKVMKAHRLVCMTFVSEQPEGKDQVNHKDGKKWNNYYKNLEWSDVSEQQIHALQLGLSKPKKGVENGACKHNEDDIRKVCAELEKGLLRQFEICKKYNISRSVVQKIQYKQRWTHISNEYSF